MNAMTRSALTGSVVMVAIAATFALGRGALPEHRFRDKPFDAAFHEDLATLAATSERLWALNRPQLVQTQSFKPIEPDPLMVALSEPPPPRRKAESDICTQNGMQKVWQGSKWRCRK
jgi:hypothetical protein